MENSQSEIFNSARPLFDADNRRRSGTMLGGKYANYKDYGLI